MQRPLAVCPLPVACLTVNLRLRLPLALPATPVNAAQLSPRQQTLRTLRRACALTSPHLSPLIRLPPLKSLDGGCYTADRS